MFGIDEFGGSDDGNPDNYSTERAGTDLTTLQGDGNSLPVQIDTDVPRQTSVTQLLGSSGTLARDVGTAFGTLRRQVSTAGSDFRSASGNASRGNSLGTWWQYASTTDKLVVGLAAVTVVLMMVKV